MVFQAGFKATWERYTTADFKVSLGLIERKVMHAKWILELYNHLCHQNEIILNGFKAASITGAVESANTVIERFRED